MYRLKNPFIIFVDGITVVAVTPDNNRIVAASGDRSISIVNILSKKCEWIFYAHSGKK